MQSSLGEFINEPYQWAYKSDNGYEVTTKGDNRFSAFNAYINTGVFYNGNDLWSIECAYHILVKGYTTEVVNSGLKKSALWKLAKGKPPKRDITPNELYQKYLALWRLWADNNRELLDELSVKCKVKVLTDKFAKTEINQAHALCDILNERYGDKL